MTYEEAKIQIQAIPEKIWDQLSEPDREAMEMAFSALESIGCEGCIYEGDIPWKLSNPCGVCKRKRTDFWRKDYVDNESGSD